MEHLFAVAVLANQRTPLYGSVLRAIPTANHSTCFRRHVLSEEPISAVLDDDITYVNGA